MEISTRAQANGSGFYRHHAGRIGVSQSSAAFHTNLAQLSKSLIKTICPAIEGLQRPTLGLVRNFDVVNGEFIQILHTGNSHLVLAQLDVCLQMSTFMIASILTLS